MKDFPLSALPATTRVSVIVLTRNRLEVVRNCVHSILRQRHRDFELVILDDASDTCDTAAAIASEFRDPRIRAFRVPRSLGVAGGRNSLMDKARGEILVAIDDDAVFVAENALDEVCRAFDREPTVGAVAFKITNVVNGKRKPRIPLRRSLIARNPAIASTPTSVSYFIGCGHAIRRRVVHECGAYRRDMVYGEEELDLAYRVIQAGYQIHYDPSIEVDHFPSPSVVGRSNQRARAELFYHVRNRAYLAYRYLPWRYALVYLGIWSIRYIADSLRQGKVLDFLRGVVATPQFLRGVKREVLNRQALAYLTKHGGRLWY